MADLFVDTSGWGNLVDRNEPFHRLAASTYRTAILQKRRVITTNYVLTEVVAMMTSPLRFPRPAVVKVIDSLKNSPFVHVVHVDSALDAEAWNLLRSRQDKEWSLIDCASFVLMNRLAIVEALTSDHHFEQAGFVRLLK
jgi:predicted nucleic acid-binding protein